MKLPVFWNWFYLNTLNAYILLLGDSCDIFVVSISIRGVSINITLFQIILIPRTDYGSAYLYLYELLMSYHGVNRNIEISSLAKLSVNYPMGILKEIVKTLMQPRRIMQLSYKPLHQVELYNLMITNKEGPVTDKDYKKFVKWYNKTPLGKQKVALMKIVEKRREMEAAQAEKQKKKK